ncbi:aldo/keto reductase [Halopelagius fulvigenes]|uniref:Aldo/keto reductase n=1 Tax=Halopelagius fulvigenes TaxID=1198324 RepID=A0ABD5U253_9EURY
MKTRALGDTGHESSVLTFGTIALNYLDQEDANEMVESVLDAGVDHFDVAPSYGDAEVKLAPKLNEHRDEIFLGCKTQERSYYGAWGSLERSLDRLGVDTIDLFQFHAVTRYDQLDAITGEASRGRGEGDHGGALRAFEEAKEEGIIDHIGLTSHGDPSLVRSAIKRIPELETVMFPFNATLDAREGPEYDYRSVLDLARERGLGTLCIKAFAKRPWPDDVPEEERPYDTWYEPYDDPDDLEECLRYALSQGMTSIPSAGDPALVPPILEAARRFEELPEPDQTRLREERDGDDSPVPAP